MIQLQLRAAPVLDVENIEIRHSLTSRGCQERESHKELAADQGCPVLRERWTKKPGGGRKAASRPRSLHPSFTGVQIRRDKHEAPIPVISASGDRPTNPECQSQCECRVSSEPANLDWVSLAFVIFMGPWMLPLNINFPQFFKYILVITYFWLIFDGRLGCQECP